MSIGCKYQETQTLDIAAIAKLIRADIKTAQTDRNNPIPPAARIRVRIERYFRGQAIDIYLEGMPDTWTYRNLDPDPDYYDGRPNSSPRNRNDQCAATVAALTDIMDAYNRDDSDSVLDYYNVRFAGDVHVRDEHSCRLR